MSSVSVLQKDPIFDEHEKMRDVRTIIFHRVSRRDLCYVSENGCFRFRDTNDLILIKSVIKMAQIRIYLCQRAHRRQIAQWSGTRTTHPEGTRFETGPAPKLGSACPHCRRGFSAPPNTPQVFVRNPKLCFFVGKT